jgi:hypothetical protein
MKRDLPSSHRRLHCTLAMAAAAVCWAASSHPALAAEPLWRQVMARKRVAADPKSDYSLVETHGPWLIMAASFNGEEGEREARELVYELRSRFNLPAYYYAMTFQLEDQRPGRGLDNLGAPIRRRYARGSQVLEHAVLVGEFHAIDDPEAQDLLQRVKTLQPDSLKVETGEPTSQNLVAWRQFQRYLKQQVGKPVLAGPMGHAFLTRNPLLPKEYFAPVGVDADVAKWNDGIEHSLLDCPKRYSIKVATFRGRTSLKAANDEIEDAPHVRRAEVSDPLVVAVKNAHELTVALRSKGWEAYEFHDRYESYVCVGSFDQMQPLPDGRLAPATREAQIIVNTFGAATPMQSLEQPGYDELGVKQEDVRKLELKQQAIMAQFDSQFSRGFGETTPGFHPKRFVGLPFDIQPQPIEAPKKTISSAYARTP